MSCSPDQYVHGSTKVSTVFDGLVDIRTLSRTKTETFLVYCWDFKESDYVIDWAYPPTCVGTTKQVRFIFDDGTSIIVGRNNHLLLRNGQWSMAADIQEGSDLMQFYRITPCSEYNNLKTKQFPRIFTFRDGWKHERQFIDEWKTGKKDPHMEQVNRACRMLIGLNGQQTQRLMGRDWNTIKGWITREGFTWQELRWLGKKADCRHVIGVERRQESETFVMPVKHHDSFCGESVVFSTIKGEPV